MSVRDTIRSRYSTLTHLKQQRNKVAGHLRAEERVKRHEHNKQVARKAERNRTALENGALKDEVHHLRLKLSNSLKESNILKSKFRIEVASMSPRRKKLQKHFSSPQTSTYQTSPQRPSTTSGMRRKRNKISNFQSTTAPHKTKQHNTTLVSTRLIATPNNEYKSFTKRIDRLKQRVKVLETQLNEEKTRSRLVQLRQLSGNSSNNNNTTNSSNKHGFSTSFWNDLRHNKNTANNDPATTTTTTTITTTNRYNRHSFQADELLQELVSKQLLESSLHMTHDIRQIWNRQLKNNIDRLCRVSFGYKKIIKLIAKVTKTAPFTSASTAATIATELSKMFGATVVRIFVNSVIEDFEAEENPIKPASCAFTFTSLANINIGKKLSKSEKIIVDVNGLTSMQVAERMKDAGNNDVLSKNSIGIGFLPATFLRGETIQGSGDLFEHPNFNDATDSSWLTRGQLSLLSVPVWFKSDTAITSMSGSGATTVSMSSVPFAVVQLLKVKKRENVTSVTTSNNTNNNETNNQENQNFDEDSIKLLEEILSVLAPALRSCSRSQSKRNAGLIHSRKTVSNSQRIETLSNNNEQNNTIHKNNVSNLLSEVTSRRIRWAAESAGVAGDVGDLHASGVQRFLHSVTNLIHCALSADRSTLYLSKDMFGGIRKFHDDDIMFVPVSRAITPLDLSSRLAMLEEGMGNPNDDDAIINSLQKTIQFDKLDGKFPNNMSTMPFHVHEDIMEDDEPNHHHTHETNHHEHKPRIFLKKRSDLPSYVARTHEIVRMTGASEEDLTKFGVDRFSNNNEEDYVSDSLLVVPIIFNEETVGVIELINKHSMSGGDTVLEEEGFNKEDETVLVHFAKELSAALSSVERQGRGERLSTRFCDLYTGVGLAKENIDSNDTDASHFPAQLIEVESVVRSLLVAEHVFIWVADHTVGGLRAYFQKNSRSSNRSGMDFLDVHYSGKQLLGSALGSAYFNGKSLNYSNLADVRASTLNLPDSQKQFLQSVDVPDLVKRASGMIIVPLCNDHANPVGVLQIINFDQRELAIRCLSHSDERLTQYTEQVAQQTATCVGCLLRMESFERVQRQTHDLLSTFSHLHHSSSLRPVDLIRTSVDIVSTIFKTSNRKITKAILILRDAKSNFVWARNIVDHDTEENGGTGAFDEMFHKFDTAKKKQRNSLCLDESVDVKLETFESTLDSFAAYVVNERRPIIIIDGVEEMEQDVNKRFKRPKKFNSGPDREMGIGSGSTLGVVIPVTQEDNAHLNDINCVLLLQRDKNTNLAFGKEDRDLSFMIVAHLCAAIASVW